MTTDSMLLSPPPLPAQAAVDRPTQKHLRGLYLSLRRGELRGSTDVALATAKALRRVISGARFTVLEELNNTIRITGAWLQEARRGEQAITNVTLRTLHLVAEESGALLDQSAPLSRSGSMLSSPPPASGYATPVRQNSSFFGSGPNTASTSNVGAYTSSSPLASPPAVGAPHRPGLVSRQDSNFFGQGSTFSIADLVTAGQNANNPIGQNAGGSGLSSGLNSGTSTPALGRGMGAFGMTASDIGFSSFAHPSQRSATQARVDEEGSDEGRENAEGMAEEEDEEEAVESSDEEDDEDESENGEVSHSGTARAPAAPQNAFHLKPLLIQVLQELIDEIETTRSNIARDARDHIHSGEIVLTLGYSATVDAFLKQAARDRTFTVIVTDAGSSKSATLLSHSLPKSIRILSIPHSSIYTLLPRVTKVVLSAHAVLANGGLLAPPGAAAATIAAKTQSTPVLVLAGLHKICGDWRWVGLAGGSGSSIQATGAARAGGGGGGQAPFPALGAAAAAGSTGDRSRSKSLSGAGCSSSSSSISSPLAGDLLTQPPQVFIPLSASSSGYSHGSGSGPAEQTREVLLNEWDYVEPAGVDVLITNTGEFPGSYVYRLIGENFVE
ncbi:nagb/rpia/CoA transferase-like protein [Microstroma glucosiphilum]|uniref:Translation initiation factor eIF2B subunit beta n=1 Tax=Pseudomicrostroma glucosiphilum TaxID=1684307 RepID=A0A316UGK7_9BASI|nr:nagb/rpia/CoA transferase-like protein [Pseudomicrostroma glucosiphilum]PWN24044.1 nagb/rpia/CoA transferase-like protein [Pseudomicrostroma glucosiphilum]